jgi:hypothetical protein
MVIKWAPAARVGYRDGWLLGLGFPQMLPIELEHMLHIGVTFMNKLIHLLIFVDLINDPVPGHVRGPDDITYLKYRAFNVLPVFVVIEAHHDLCMALSVFGTVFQVIVSIEDIDFGHRTSHAEMAAPRIGAADEIIYLEFRQDLDPHKIVICVSKGQQVIDITFVIYPFDAVIHSIEYDIRPERIVELRNHRDIKSKDSKPAHNIMGVLGIAIGIEAAVYRLIVVHYCLRLN